MPTVSVTRLRIRRWRFLPAFTLRTLASARDASRAEGFLGGAVLADRAGAFWTLTMWADETHMRAFMVSGAHQRAMPELANWCDEAAVARWSIAEPALPSWSEADATMRASGRASRVRHPSPRHQDLSFAPPAHTNAAPIRPRAG